MIRASQTVDRLQLRDHSNGFKALRVNHKTSSIRVARSESSKAELRHRSSRKAGNRSS